MATHHLSVTTPKRNIASGRKVRVAFQGERGAYGDDAIADRWRGSAIPVPSWTFDDVVRAVIERKVDFGLLPVENAIVGRIESTHDALSAATLDLHIVEDDIVVPVRHALLAPLGATFSELARVTSHPVALAQCGQFLAAHPHLVAESTYDTAGAARDVAARNDATESAIASVSAAARYKLQVMAEDIQDVADNWTRFAVIALEARW